MAKPLIGRGEKPPGLVQEYKKLSWGSEGVYGYFLSCFLKKGKNEKGSPLREGGAPPPTGEEFGWKKFLGGLPGLWRG